MNDIKCECPPDFEGELCSDKIIIDSCDSIPCKNDGNCVHVSNNVDGPIECDCQTGWTNNFCEIDIPECASTPCQNSGTCTEGFLPEDMGTYRVVFIKMIDFNSLIENRI